MPIDLDSLAEDLLADEDIRLHVYDDATGEPLHPGMTLKGHPTIGIGRALDTNGISREEAQMLLRDDMIRCTDDLLRALPWIDDLNPVRQRVLANMAFNLGTAGLLQFHAALTLCQKGDYTGAANEMLKSQWAKQVGDRAIRLSNRMRMGVA